VGYFLINIYKRQVAEAYRELCGEQR